VSRVYDWRKGEVAGLPVFFRNTEKDPGVEGRNALKRRSQVYVALPNRLDQIESSCSRGLPQAGIYEPHERTLALCAYGPSLRDYIDELRETSAEIMTTSGAHDVLIENGITPRYHVECDAQPHKAKLVTMPNDETEYCIASCCHPDVFDNLKGRKVVIWHMANSPEENAGIEKNYPNSVKVIGSATSGGRSMGLGFVFGYRRFMVYGMDSSFPFDESSPVEDQPQHAGQHPNKDRISRKVHITDEINGKRYYTTLPLLISAQAFYTIAERTKGQFMVRGDSMLAAMVKVRNHPRLTAYPDAASLAQWLDHAAQAAKQPRKGPVPEDSPFGRERAAERDIPRPEQAAA
jgi:uncharacterized Rossmann fold enzyme